jgi:reductive dehalogenase
MTMTAITDASDGLGPWPRARVRRVDRPTTRVTDQVCRIDARETAYGLAERGEYGTAVQRGIADKPPERYPLSAAQKDVLDHLAGLEAKRPANAIAPVPQDPWVLTQHVKALGRFFRADFVATCRVPVSAYYSHDRHGTPVSPAFPNAIVFIMRKDRDAMQASTGTDWMGDPISFQAYQHLALVGETIANYIRRLGWEASPQYGPSFVDRYSVLLAPLLLASGIGEVCRIGIILNPYLGPAFKAAAVLTTMPLIPDQPIDFGLQAFCRDCTICAGACPSRAIPTGDKVLHNGYETWKLNTQRCATFNFSHRKGTLCNRCVKSCPWSNPSTWPHNLVRALVTRSGLMRRAAIMAAGRMGTDRGRAQDQWWFHIECRDGEIQSPGRGRRCDGPRPPTTPDS